MIKMTYAWRNKLSFVRILSWTVSHMGLQAMRSWIMQLIQMAVSQSEPETPCWAFQDHPLYRELVEELRRRCPDAAACVVFVPTPREATARDAQLRVPEKPANAATRITNWYRPV